MTNEEAIKWLESINEKYIHGGDEWYDEQRHEAIKIAIKALEEVKGLRLLVDTADFQIPSQMRLSKLRTLLDNYDDKDMVQLRIYGSSDYPSADLVINDNTIMSDEY